MSGSERAEHLGPHLLLCRITENSPPTTYELWHLEGKSMIDWFEDRGEALEAVRAYLDADEAELVALIVRDANGAVVMSPSGAALTEWASRLSAAS